jgi:hypothetical protein
MHVRIHALQMDTHLPFMRTGVAQVSLPRQANKILDISQTHFDIRPKPQLCKGKVGNVSGSATFTFPQAGRSASLGAQGEKIVAALEIDGQVTCTCNHHS